MVLVYLYEVGSGEFQSAPLVHNFGICTCLWGINMEVHMNICM